MEFGYEYIQVLTIPLLPENTAKTTNHINATGVSMIEDNNDITITRISAITATGTLINRARKVSIFYSLLNSYSPIYLVSISIPKNLPE